jgi:hypothetical protein
MSKHTQGPWTVGTTEYRFNANMIYAGEEIVCSVYGIPSHRAVNECQPSTGMENARLIAAAPDLLEALKDCAALLSLLGFELSDEYRRTITAIAKAEAQS